MESGGSKYRRTNATSTPCMRRDGGAQLDAMQPRRECRALRTSWLIRPTTAVVPDDPLGADNRPR